MNIEDYRRIITIAELGSITSAAKQLFISQSSLSQCVQNVENAYGVTLFTRGAKKGIKTQLTPEGKCFIEYAKQIIANEADLAKALTRTRRDAEASLRMGISRFIYSDTFSRVISAYRKSNPHIYLQLVHQNSRVLQKSLNDGDIDVAICYTPVSFVNLEYQVLCHDRFVFFPAAGSSMEQKIRKSGTQPKGTIKVDMLCGEPIASGIPGSELQKYVDQKIVSVIDSPTVHCVADTEEALFFMAKCGIASTFLLESFFDDNSKKDLSYYYLDTWPDDEQDIVVAYQKDLYPLPTPIKSLIKIISKNMPDKNGPSGSRVIEIPS